MYSLLKIAACSNLAHDILNPYTWKIMEHGPLVLCSYRSLILIKEYKKKLLIKITLWCAVRIISFVIWILVGLPHLLGEEGKHIMNPFVLLYVSYVGNMVQVWFFLLQALESLCTSWQTTRQIFACARVKLWHFMFRENRCHASKPSQRTMRMNKVWWLARWIVRKEDSSK